MSKARSKIKHISLNGLRFSDERGNFVCAEDYFLTFRNKEMLEKFLNKKHKEFEEILGMKLVFAQESAETLAEIEVYNILKMVAKKLGVSLEAAQNESTKDAVEVRRFTIKICIERHVRIGVIAKSLNMAHDLVIYHRNKLDNIFEVDKKYNDRYIEIEDYVFSTLYGRFVDDGSGEKAKQDKT